MFENMTREVNKARMLANTNPPSGLTTIEGGFLDQVYGPFSVEIEKIYMTLDAILGVMAIDETCGGLIDVAADNFSVVRKEGIRATVEVDFEGESGAYIPAGSIFATASGLQYELQQAVTLGGDGVGHGVLIAEDVGDAYNVAAGVIDRMLVNPVGLTSFSAHAATGGVNTEGDGALVDRYYDKLQRPATSGNPNHYREWALEVPGVGDAKVISLVDGPGTVGVTLVSEDFGPVGDSVVAAAVAHIEKSRTVGIEAAPNINSAQALPINVVVVSKLDISTTPASVAEELQAQLDKYLRTIVKAKYAQTYDGPDDDGPYSLSYNRVATILMTLPGVEDYTSLTINGGKADIVIGKDQVPVIGEVSVT